MNEIRRQIFGALLEECTGADVVRVLFDARVEGVRVPDYLRTGGVWFEYSHNMAVPIRDLVIDDAGISATLSIQRTPSATFVPWEAVRFVDAPLAVKKRAVGRLMNEAVQAVAAATGAPDPAPRKLRLVADDEAPADNDERPVDPATVWGPRLVKGGQA